MVLVLIILRVTVIFITIMLIEIYDFKIVQATAAGHTLKSSANLNWSAELFKLMLILYLLILLSYNLPHLVLTVHAMPLFFSK